VQGTFLPHFYPLLDTIDHSYELWLKESWPRAEERHLLRCCYCCCCFYYSLHSEHDWDDRGWSALEQPQRMILPDWWGSSPTDDNIAVAAVAVSHTKTATSTSNHCSYCGLTSSDSNSNAQQRRQRHESQSVSMESFVGGANEKSRLSEGNTVSFLYLSLSRTARHIIDDALAVPVDLGLINQMNDGVVCGVWCVVVVLGCHRKIEELNKSHVRPQRQEMDGSHCYVPPRTTYCIGTYSSSMSFQPHKSWRENIITQCTLYIHYMVLFP
jgi:hypothetical protein